jgi:hypothetical protein
VVPGDASAFDVAHVPRAAAANAPTSAAHSQPVTVLSDNSNALYIAPVARIPAEIALRICGMYVRRLLRRFPTWCLLYRSRFGVGFRGGVFLGVKVFYLFHLTVFPEVFTAGRLRVRWGECYMVALITLVLDVHHLLFLWAAFLRAIVP